MNEADLFEQVAGILGRSRVGAFYSDGYLLRALRERFKSEQALREYIATAETELQTEFPGFAFLRDGAKLK